MRMEIAKFLFVVLLLYLIQLLLPLYPIYISQGMLKIPTFISFSDSILQKFLLKPLASLSQLGLSPQANVDESEGRRCIVYDRPPRTGSTTISKTLGQCLISLGYRQPKWMGNEARADDIFNMLHQPYADVGLVSRHFFMNASSLEHLHRGCDSLFYISSTAPMKERVWSVMKYRQLGKHGNGSLSDAQMNQAVADLEKHDKQVKLLNSYPFWKDMDTALDTRGIERPNPDYVIRKSKLTLELSDLLQTLQCDTDVRSDNIHRADVGGLLNDIEIDDDDELHRRMVHRAERHNQKGLKKALKFLKR